MLPRTFSPTDSQRGLRQHRECTTKIILVLPHSRVYETCFLARGNAGKPKEKYARVRLALAKHEIAEVLVAREQERVPLRNTPAA